ncbi:hypothetical protein KIN20_018109 [Parelaphostrongylus tenuis]|uniref:Uncharacterized protein n=1 Tax=Parelaphostrongylus tenuis TaxID=148309 RepID=A0AAD5QRY8_PARTN|nr:hypothetical protein KIN20_018109 [Parelaphostrongylus tenuis]
MFQHRRIAGISSDISFFRPARQSWRRHCYKEHDGFPTSGLLEVKEMMSADCIHGQICVFNHAQNLNGKWFSHSCQMPTSLIDVNYVVIYELPTALRLSVLNHD